LIATAVEAELAGSLAQFADLRTETGHAAVVRNGHHPTRLVQTGIGPVSVRIPKVRSKDGTPVSFQSALVPPYVRRTKTLEAALPWLYLKGISSGEMAPALKVLLGPDAAGLSANSVSRLKRDWAKEYEGWKEAELDDEPIVYIWPPLGRLLCNRLPVNGRCPQRPSRRELQALRPCNCWGNGPWPETFLGH
jgi:putative transposase